MPPISVDALRSRLSGRDLQLAEACLNNGHLRASKPRDGEAAYVWRMVAFQVSPKPIHHCMPMTADFALPDTYWHGEGAGDRRRARLKELNAIVDAVVDAVPRTQWHGVRRWGRALGQLA